jgi:hypothetical protein
MTTAEAYARTRAWERQDRQAISERALVIIGALAYIAGLHILYVAVVVPDWGTAYLPYRPPGAHWVVAAWILALCPALFMPVRLTRPSMYIYWALYLTVHVPGALMPLYTEALPLEQAILVPIGMIPLMALMRLCYSVKPVRIPRLAVPMWAMIASLALLALVATAMNLRSVSLSTFALNLVYETRDEWKGNISGVARYFYIWQANVMGPFLLVIGLAKRNPWLIALALLNNLALFASSGLKSILFAPVGAAGAWAVVRWNSSGAMKRYLALLAVALLAITAVDGLYLERTMGRGLISSYTVRRMVYVPGLLTGLYVDYYSTHPKTYFTEGRVLSWTGEYPYELGIPNMIGYQYFNNPEMNANANIWAMGYADMGWPGMLLITLMLMPILWTIDSLARGHPRAGVVGVLVMPMFTLSNTSLFVALLTWGLGLTMLLLYLAPLGLFRRS